MPRSFNVIALISGGKDSLFTVAHCYQLGHQVVALANLCPPPLSTDDDGIDDLNSFMYQTVGHQVIPLYAEALDKPLYRRTIRGSAVITGQSYDINDPTADSYDETEDLFELLKHVKTEHPGANAVCSGAILSDYQRTRVESVALRLGLTPLAYLWRYTVLPRPVGSADSATGLLADMGEAGCDARLVKIATGGGENISMTADITTGQGQDTIVRSLRQYFEGDDFGLRTAAIGEGGEYETIALDGPAPVWKRSLFFYNIAHGIVDERRDGVIRYALLGEGSTIPKTDTVHDDHDTNVVPVPAALDKTFAAVSDELCSLASSSPVLDCAPYSYLELPIAYSKRFNSTGTCVRSGCHLSIANLMIDSLTTTADQLLRIIARLTGILDYISERNNISPPLSTSDISSTTLLLSSMSDFNQVNNVYLTMFKSGGVNPPSRVTIATRLPEGVRVSLSVHLSGITPTARKARRGLHVQSQSYWAPANIGPYSQAISTPMQMSVQDRNCDGTVVHISGQIPLVPQNMELSNEPFFHQAILSLQHLWRVGQERDVDVWPWGVAFVSSTVDTRPCAQIPVKIWHQLYKSANVPVEDEASHDEDFDVSDLQKSFRTSLRHGPLPAFDDHLHCLPNPSVVEVEPGKSAIPPIIVAKVSALPRGASIEWWSTGIAGMTSKYSRVECLFETQIWAWGTMSTTLFRTRDAADAKFGVLLPTSVAFRALLLHVDHAGPSAEMISTLRTILSPTPTCSGGIVHGTAFATVGQGLVKYEEIASEIGLEGVAVIPTETLQGAAFCGKDDTEMKALCMALLLRSDTTKEHAEALDLTRGSEEQFRAK